MAGDGSRVLTVRDVGRAEVWDAGSGDRVGTIRPESPLEGVPGASPTGGAFKVFIEAAALDAKGEHALLGLNDGTGGVFRVADGSRVALLRPPGGHGASGFGVIRAVAFTADSSMALVGFSDRRVGVWSADGRRLIAFLTAPSGARLFKRPFVRDTLVSSVGMSTDGFWVFAGCADGTAVVWELATGRVVFEAVQHVEHPLALFDDDSGVGWATTAGNLWVCTGEEPPRQVLATGEQWSEVAFARQALLARSPSGAVTHWTFAGLRTSQYEPPEPLGNRWSDKAKTLGFHGEARWHYPQGGDTLIVHHAGGCAIIERGAQLVTARFTPAGDAVATAGWRDQLELWSAHDGRLLRAFPAPGGVASFCISADGGLLAIGELGQGGGRYPRDVLVYETGSGELVHHLRGHDWQVRRVEFSPSGRELAGLAQELLVWDLSGPPASRSSFRAPAERGDTFRFLSGGRLALIGERGARIFRGGALQLAVEAPVPHRAPWCLSQDERFLSVATPQGITRTELRSGASRRVHAPIPRPEGLRSSPAVRDAGLRVDASYWRTEQGTFLHQGDGPRGWVERLALSPTGEVLVPSRDGAALLALSPALALLGTVPFEGKLRASQVLSDRVILVNHQGRVFRSAKPA